MRSKMSAKQFAVRVDAVGIATFTAFGVMDVCEDPGLWGLACFVGAGLFFWDLWRITRGM